MVEYTKWRQVLSIACRSLGTLRRAVCLGVVCLSAGSRGGADDAPAASLPPFYLIRRAIVLPVDPTAAPDATVQGMIARQKALQPRSRRRRLRLNVRPSTAASPPKYAQIGQKPPTVKPSPGSDRVPEGERRPLAQGLLCDALADRLREELHVQVVPDEEVRSALKELHLTASQAANPPDAARLCAVLRCQALFMPDVVQVSIHDGMERDVSVRAVISATYADLDAAALTLHRVNRPPARTRGRRPRGTSAVREPVAASSTALPETLPVVGSVRVEHPMFRSAYLQTQAAAIRVAAAHAAGGVIRTLRTGQSSPFALSGVRVGVGPVSAPEAVDLLVFTAQGRHVEAGALRGLPHDVSALFTPNLDPIAADATVGPELARRQMQGAGVTPEALWLDESTPLPTSTRALGQRLNVDYLLMARVTDIEMEQGPNQAMPTPRGAALEQEARVETSGALVRVADGAVVWRDRAIADLTERVGSARTVDAARRLVHDATRFSLIDLARRFTRYLDSFSQ